MFNINNLKTKWSTFSSKDKVIYKNVTGAFVVKGLALIVSFFTMPAYMHYFNNQQVLGVWFTLLSILIWILNFDLGIGNGLRNHLAKSLAKKDIFSAKQFISSAYFMLGGIVFILSIVGYFIIPFINWNKVLNISVDILQPILLYHVVQYVFLGIMIHFFLRIISSILYAMQKSAINNFLGLVTSVLLLLVVLFAPSSTISHNLVLLSVSYGICINLPQLIATIITFSTSLKKCIPNIKYISNIKTKAILSLGGIFFICQILYMLIANTNEIFITQYTDTSYVVDYQIYNRLFSLVSMIFMLGLTPIWSMVTKANAEKDFKWLLNLNQRLFKLALIFSVFEFVLIPFLPFIIRIWLGSKAITVNYLYALFFAIFGGSMLFQNVVSTITNGLGRMKLQAISYACGVIFKILVIHFGMLFFHNWTLVILANTFILIPYILIQNKKNIQYIEKNLNYNRK